MRVGGDLAAVGGGVPVEGAVALEAVDAARARTDAPPPECNPFFRGNVAAVAAGLAPANCSARDVLAASALWDVWRHPAAAAGLRDDGVEAFVRVPPLHATAGVPRKRARVEREERGTLPAGPRAVPIRRGLQHADCEAALVRRALEVRDPDTDAWHAVHVVSASLGGKPDSAPPTAVVALADGSTAVLDLKAAVADGGSSVRIRIEAASRLEREAAAVRRDALGLDEHGSAEDAAGGAGAGAGARDLDTEPDMGWTRARLAGVFQQLTGVDIHTRRITKERMLAMVLRAVRGQDPDDVQPADIEAALRTGRSDAPTGTGTGFGAGPPPMRDGRYLVRNRDARLERCKGPVEVLKGDGGDARWVPATAVAGFPKKGMVRIMYEQGAGEALEGTQEDFAFSEERVAWPVGRAPGGKPIEETELGQEAADAARAQAAAAEAKRRGEEVPQEV